MTREAEVLFYELADLSAAERQAYFDRQHIPVELRAEVESLLRFDSSTVESLTDRVAGTAEQLLHSSAGVRKDTRCGPYRLVRILGHGGMGSVWMGQRDDGEVEQRVAIKFLRYGSGQAAFRDRFFRERQILASLNHPGIARLLDAGHTADGQPYLVMDYVEGTPIDAPAARLDLRATLVLFTRVCDAISYAHRNLIIHRDLKPSNILVDAEGQPKLLDFGIAKILDSASNQTQTRDRMMTVEYASPEQVRGTAQTTATDVYSLGAVLYKLLTGRSPHASAENDKAAEFAICFEEPPPPSRFNLELPQDLDFVLGKALRTEPDERYATVEALAGDVRAFLESRPVRARSGDAWYRTRKFLRRYWVSSAAAALVVTSLSVGLYVANRERAIAHRRFQQVRELSNQLFELDQEIRSLPGATKARHRIVSTSLSYLERLGAEARQDTDLALEIAAAYLQVARVQGVPGQSNLGQFAEAGQSLSKADAFVEFVRARSPKQRSAVLLSAEIAHDAMILAEAQHRYTEGLAHGRKAAGRLDALLETSSVTSDEAAAARLYVSLALSHSNMHHVDDAARFARRSVETSRRLGHDQRQLSRGLSVLANAARFAGDLDGALKAVREARAIAEKMADPNDAGTTLTLAAAFWREGVILGELNNISLDRPQEAAPLLQKAFDLAEDLARKDPHDYTTRTYVSIAGRELGDVLREADPVRALALYDHTRRRLIEIKDNAKARRDQVWLLAGSAYALRSLGRPTDSKKRIDAALALLRDVKDYPAERVTLGEPVNAALRALADHYADTDQTALAIQTYEELLAKAQASNPQPETDLRHANSLSRIYRDLGKLHARAGQADQANVLHRRRLELWRHWDRKLPNNVFVLRQLMASN